MRRSTNESTLIVGALAIAAALLVTIVRQGSTKRPGAPPEQEDDRSFYDVEGEIPRARCRGDVPVAPASSRSLAWPKGGSVQLTTHGSFSTHAPDSQNWLNAPPSQRRAPPLDADRMWLDKLNCAFAPALDGVLSGARLRVAGRGLAALPRSASTPLDGGDDDEDFALAVHVGGNTEVGGHYGGLTIRMELTSNHRPSDVVSGSSTVKIATRVDAGSAVELLESLLATALSEAFENLHSRLDEGSRKPIRELTLAFDTTGLTKAQRTEIDKSLARCAVGLGSSLGFDPLDDADGMLRYRVRYRLQKFDDHETEADYIAHYASWLHEICDHGQCRCSTWRGALDGYTSERSADVAAKRIVVRFKKAR